MHKILSPITKSNNVKHVKSIDAAWIIKKWKDSYSFDVSYLFKKVQALEIYECKDTGYKFYYPAIMGDSRFYEQCQKNDWYYMPWKWEHEQATIFLAGNSRVLEIGCAEGHFLEKILSFDGLKCEGLELNKKAFNKALDKGLNVYNETLEKYAVRCKGIYDVVCCFQVLEHIADVDSFIRAGLSCLKTNGKLIYSVPNNGTYISDMNSILNMPPHHVGLWDEQSLRSISEVYNIKFENLLYEPLQDYHLQSFKSTVYRRVIGKKFENRVIRKLCRELFLSPFVDKYLDYCQKWIPGHTILAVYSKLDN